MTPPRLLQSMSPQVWHMADGSISVSFLRYLRRPSLPDRTPGHDPYVWTGGAMQDRVAVRPCLLVLARATRFKYLLTIYCPEADSCGVRSAVTKTPSR